MISLQGGRKGRSLDKSGTYYHDTPSRGSLCMDNDQDITLVDRLTFADTHLFDGPCNGRGEIVLHFHGLKHDDGLASRDGGSHLQWYTEYQARHGGTYHRLSGRVG